MNKYLLSQPIIFAAKIDTLASKEFKWRNFMKVLHFTTESCQNSSYLSEGTLWKFCTLLQKVIETLLT